jgi:hypothetical protein
VRARVVKVQILVHVKDKVGRCVIQVHHAGQRRRAPCAYKRHGTSKVRPRQKDHLCRCPGLTDSRHCSLDCLRPHHNVEVVWLVHKTKDYLLLILVLRRELRPERGELCIRRSALPNDGVVPTPIVVDINHAVGSCGEARLHQLVILGKVFRVQLVGGKIAGYEVLPRDGWESVSCADLDRRDRGGGGIEGNERSRNIVIWSSS